MDQPDTLPHGRLRLRCHSQIAEFAPAAWNALAGPQPFLQHAFLHALEASGCASPASGWTPRHLALWQDDMLMAAMPLYEKTHSYGEFVFDWAWADAWERAGQNYYPKLVCAVPFSPISGPRVLARDVQSAHILRDQALDFARSSACSSLHVLFDADTAPWTRHDLLLREGVQFHWFNRGHVDFEGFLGSLHRDKRKKIRQERRRVAESGVALRRIGGHDISEAQLDIFYRCYVATYRVRGRLPYLSEEFFRRLRDAMPEHLLLVLAERDGEPVAAALNLCDDTRLYGRYWGELEHVPLLHFEACYYQGIEHCIERGLQVFEGGAQGEHKLARGFDPVVTYSVHWLRDARFNDAVARWLAREREGVDAYVDELNEHSAYQRHTVTSNGGQ